MRSKARRNQLNLSCTEPKQKPEMLKTVSSQSQSGRKRGEIWWERFVKEVGFEPGVSMKELWVIKVVN